MNTIEKWINKSNYGKALFTRLTLHTTQNYKQQHLDNCNYLNLKLLLFYNNKLILTNILTSYLFVPDLSQCVAYCIQILSYIYEIATDVDCPKFIIKLGIRSYRTAVHVVKCCWWRLYCSIGFYTCNRNVNIKINLNYILSKKKFYAFVFKFLISNNLKQWLTGFDLVENRVQVSRICSQ